MSEETIILIEMIERFPLTEMIEVVNWKEEIFEEVYCEL